MIRCHNRPGSLLINYPRIKKLPDKLIYCKIVEIPEVCPYPIYNFTMFSTEKGNHNTSTMRCFPALIDRGDKKNVPSLHIDFLSARHTNNGFGSAMVDFAKIISKRLGCKGNIDLLASVGFEPQRIPHVFYRKHGFTTDNIKIDGMLDRYVMFDRNATYKNFNTIPMYYPEITPVNTKSKSKIFRYLKKIISSKP